MKFMAVHRRDGTIVSLTAFEPDAPPASAAPAPGEAVAEIEVPEGMLDVSTLETEERVMEALRELRIEVGAEAQLVRRPARAGD
jgi:hypothetical protein